MKRAEQRKQKTQIYFDDFVANDDTVTVDEEVRVMSTQELIMLEEDTKQLERREKEINEIVRGISDLNMIFKDLAQMVSEQGSVIDRIDHNVENTQIKVHDGLEQLKKAEKYQRSNRKMKCILILAVIVVILLIVLAIKVS